VITGDYRRLPTITDDYRRLPAITGDVIANEFDQVPLLLGGHVFLKTHVA
jgi:hypothetical protein